MVPKIFNEIDISPNDYFLTGSKALDYPEINFSCSSISSDYDYVVKINKRHLILSKLNEKIYKIEDSCYNGGFKFIEDDKVYNIITCIDIEFNAWKEALFFMKHLILTDEKYRNVIQNKMKRYCIYEQLRAIVKTIITMGI